MRVQGEIRVPRQREIIHSQCVQRLRSFNLRRRCPCRTDFGKTVRNEEDEDDEQSVGGALDFEVAEERICAE